jgi:hypothetical protein
MRDIEHFVKLFGYSPSEALACATRIGAELMDMGHELGQVREGYLADLLLVDGDPVADVSILQRQERLVAIMQNGNFHKLDRDALARPHGRIGAGYAFIGAFWEAPPRDATTPDRPKLPCHVELVVAIFAQSVSAGEEPLRCSKCGSDNPEGAKFCIDCAAPLANRCPECRQENLPRAKFCADCATPLNRRSSKIKSCSA